MANTYSRLYVHVVFAVRGRYNLISKSWRSKLYKYITGIVKAKKQKLMIINGVENHVHILLGIQPDIRLSELVRDIKANSARWINEHRYAVPRFEWQEGFGAFSVNPADHKQLIRYIERQEEHHQKHTFKEEYMDFLKDHDIEFVPEYIFEDYGAAPTGLITDRPAGAV
jgi:putative transposase